MNKQQQFNIIIACGGTGGHLFPGIAVAQQLKQMGHKPTLLISCKDVDAHASAQYGDLDFMTIQAVAMPKLFSTKIFGFAWKLFQSVRQCRKILKKTQADAVVGMGGFTSLPPVYAAHRMHLSSFVHDSNAMPGKANRLAARWCDKVFVGMAEASHYFPKSECVVTGTPVREEICSTINHRDAALQYNLNPNKPIILVMGGSQGAQQINTVMVDAAQADSSIQLLLLAGARDYERVAGLAMGMENVHVLPFCTEMPVAYAAADAVIARSGASSITELSYLGKAALLIPYPFAADDHQSHNARVYAAHGAARVQRQDSFSVDSALAFIHEVVHNDEARSQMEEAARTLSLDDAAMCIARAIEDSVK